MDAEGVGKMAPGTYGAQTAERKTLAPKVPCATMNQVDVEGTKVQIVGARVELPEAMSSANVDPLFPTRLWGVEPSGMAQAPVSVHELPLCVYWKMLFGVPLRTSRM